MDRYTRYEKKNQPKIRPWPQIYEGEGNSKRTIELGRVPPSPDLTHYTTIWPSSKIPSLVLTASTLATFIGFPRLLIALRDVAAAKYYVNVFSNGSLIGTCVSEANEFFAERKPKKEKQWAKEAFWTLRRVFDKLVCDRVLAFCFLSDGVLPYSLLGATKPAELRDLKNDAADSLVVAVPLFFGRNDDDLVLPSRRLRYDINCAVECTFVVDTVLVKKPKPSPIQYERPLWDLHLRVDGGRGEDDERFQIYIPSSGEYVLLYVESTSPGVELYSVEVYASEPWSSTIVDMALTLEKRRGDLFISYYVISSEELKNQTLQLKGRKPPDAKVYTKAYQAGGKRTLCMKDGVVSVR